MARLIRIAGSFAIIVVVYLAYAFLAKLWIEPMAAANQGDGIDQKNRDGGRNFADVQLEQLKGLFPPNAWQLNSPLVLESDRAKLLFREYHNFPDGRVELTPCTIVFAHQGRVDEEQRRRQAVILESPGATLQFDQPMDFSRGKIGRLIRGQLKDKVIIRSDWKEPGPEDDLYIETSNLQLTEQTISTPETVKFRWGPHFGSGQDMVMKLVTVAPQPGMEQAGPNITGVESFELRRVERPCISKWARPWPSRTRKPASVPVEINCRGPFRFDVQRQVATFRDRVDVLKANPTGPADQIACDVLSLYFTDRSKSPSEPAKTDPKVAGSLDLVPQRIEAIGNPAVVTAPSQNVVSRAERLQYDIQANSIALDGGQEVFLQQGPNEIHARTLFYKSSEQGRMGQVAAKGPGWLHGQAPDRPDQRLEAIWKDQLRVQPDKQNQVISLTGGAELKYQGVGQLQAKEIFFWLLEAPPKKKGGQPDLNPDRMMGRGDVHMNSPQLAGKFEQMEVWFEQGPGASVPSGGPGTPLSPALPIGAAAPLQQPQPAIQPGQQPGTQQLSPQRFEALGRVLRARVLLAGQEQAALSNLTIEDQVCFRETQTAKPNERPVLIRGDRLEVRDATTSRSTVTVVGRPAHFEGRGLALNGANINLNRGANRLWVDGPGQMNAPIPEDRAAPDQPAAPAGVMTIDWRRGMEFDGRTAKFVEGVVANAPQRQLQTEMMRVQILPPISFTDSSPQKEPEVEEIQCCGGVKMAQRTFDQNQQITSHDRIELTDLAINFVSGVIKGGPGWLNSVRMGSDNPLGASPIAAAQAGPVAPAPSHLCCVHVRFKKSVVGNIGGIGGVRGIGGLARREGVTFTDQVQMAYSPVNNWDAMLATTDPDKLGPQGITVRCDQLSVVQMSLALGNMRSIELDALGNAVVENTEFTARGHRITYSEEKDWLILKGGGRSMAELFWQKEPGAERSELTGQELHYWPKTKRIRVINAQSLQGGQLPQDMKPK